METIITCTIFGVFILVAYTLGLKNGQKLVKQEQIELPNPVRAITDTIEARQEQKIISEYQKLFDNIDNYDNPAYSQKDVKINE